MKLEIEKVKRSMRSKKRNVVKESNPKRINFFLTKLLITVILTLGILIGIKKSDSFKSHFYKQVYDTNFSFVYFNSLYEKYFGSALPFENLFLDKTVPVFNESFSYSKVEPYEEGAKFIVSNNYLMPVLESGMVVFVGEKEGYGNTIIVQQINGVDLWYCNINSNVNLYDYVEKGEALGESLAPYIYLVFRKDGSSQNYEDFI